MESLLQLEVDLEPFNAHFPHMTRPSSIGDGVKYLNRQAGLHSCLCSCWQALLLSHTAVYCQNAFSCEAALLVGSACWRCEAALLSWHKR